MAEKNNAEAVKALADLIRAMPENPFGWRNLIDWDAVDREMRRLAPTRAAVNRLLDLR